MSETRPRLEQKYTTGVWYDQMNGDYCEIQLGLFTDDDERIIELVNPETGNVYWDMPISQWLDEKKYFRQVHERAVNNPVDYYKSTVENLLESSQYSGKRLPFREEISFEFARQQVDIQEA